VPNFSYEAALSNLTISPAATLWCFVAFFLAFAVKVPDVPVPHLAAGRARRSADRRLGGAGEHHAQARHLRLHSLRDAAHAGARSTRRSGRSSCGSR
jgi:hypothetical protein